MTQCRTDAGASDAKRLCLAAKHTVFTVTSGSYGQSADDHRVKAAREAPLSFLNAIEVAPGFLHVTSSSACPFFRVYAAL